MSFGISFAFVFILVSLIIDLIMMLSARRNVASFWTFNQDGFKFFKIFNFIAILCSYNITVVIMKYQVLLNLNRIQSILRAIPWSSDVPVLVLNQPSINTYGSCVGGYLNLLKVGVQECSGIAFCYTQVCIWYSFPHTRCSSYAGLSLVVEWGLFV